jgi:citrate synthase
MNCLKARHTGTIEFDRIQNPINKNNDMRYHGTDIDGPSLDPDTLNVRGIDLMELVGNHSFLASFFFTLHGELPTQEQEAELNRFYVEAFRSIDTEDPIFTIVPAAAPSIAHSLNGLLAGMAVDRRREIDRIDRPDFGTKNVGDIEKAGFYHDSILAIVSWLATEAPSGGYSQNELKQRLVAAQNTSGDFVDRLTFLFLGKTFDDPREKRLLEAILTACHCGFGYLTPTVMTPRITIGSGVPTGIALLAGYTTAGPYHAGAGQEVIEFIQHLMDTRTGELQSWAKAMVADRIAGRKPIFGFGHPLFKRDPRPVRMEALVRELNYNSEYLDMYYAVQKEAWEQRNLNPNAEGINAAIMLSLGFDKPFHSPALVLVSRTAAMVAHLKERMQRPPFGVKSKVAREYLNKVPTGWI